MTRWEYIFCINFSDHCMFPPDIDLCWYRIPKEEGWQPILLRQARQWAYVKLQIFLKNQHGRLAAAILILCVVATATIPRGSETGRCQELKMRLTTRLIRMLFRHFRQHSSGNNNTISREQNSPKTKALR